MTCLNILRLKELNSCFLNASTRFAFSRNMSNGHNQNTIHNTFGVVINYDYRKLCYIDKMLLHFTFAYTPIPNRSPAFYYIYIHGTRGHLYSHRHLFTLADHPFIIRIITICSMICGITYKMIQTQQFTLIQRNTLWS